MVVKVKQWTHQNGPRAGMGSCPLWETKRQHIIGNILISAANFWTSGQIFPFAGVEVKELWELSEVILCFTVFFTWNLGFCCVGFYACNIYYLWYLMFLSSMSRSYCLNSLFKNNHFVWHYYLIISKFGKLTGSKTDNFISQNTIHPLWVDHPGRIERIGTSWTASYSLIYDS